MALKGIQKATLLLTLLDSTTASELLKGQPQEVIQKIAVELSHQDAKGDTDPERAIQAGRQFYDELQRSQSGSMHVKSFVNALLQGSAGNREKAAEIQAKMKQAMMEKDPFLALSSAAPAHLAAALEDEPPQAIAVVLSSLPSKLTSEVLVRLDQDTCQQTIWRMTRPGDVTPRTMRRIGEVVCKRLMDMTSDQGAPVTDDTSYDSLRRVAIILSGLEKEKRDAMLSVIQQRDNETATRVRALMVTWDDIVKIEDKSLQQALRSVEPTVLAKALHNAESTVRDKVVSNISERMMDMIEEETTLMGEPRKKDVIAAREKVAQPLREANEAGELLFIEEDED